MKSKISPSLIENEDEAGAGHPPLPTGCCVVPMNARVKTKARVIRRGHRVSVAKRRADRNAGGSG